MSDMCCFACIASQCLLKIVGDGPGQDILHHARPCFVTLAKATTCMTCCAAKQLNTKLQHCRPAVCTHHIQSILRNCCHYFGTRFQWQDEGAACSETLRRAKSGAVTGQYDKGTSNHALKSWVARNHSPCSLDSPPRTSKHWCQHYLWNPQLQALSLKCTVKCVRVMMKQATWQLVGSDMCI